MALLLEQEAGVHPDEALGHLVPGEVPRGDEPQDGQHQDRSAAGEQERHASGKHVIHQGPALQEPLEGIAAEEETDGGKRHPTPDKR
ncbi:hypothetical protein D9M72_504140 [compost metagenome]